LAVYAIDWDNLGRAETVEITDSAGHVLDTRGLSNFLNGQYLAWTVAGHVKIQVNRTSGPNAVLSGVFLGGGGAGATSQASFVKLDTGTRGTWKGVYGSAGYNVIGDRSSYPSYVTVTPSGQYSYTWAASTTDTRALQKASSSTDRIASTWYSSIPFSVDLNFTDSNIHQVAVYCVDWDVRGRSQTLSITDASGNRLDSRSVSGFSSGQYLVWNVAGHVKLQVTPGSGPNAVISGLFFQ